MKQSKFQALMFSAIGVAVAFAVVVLLNFVISRSPVRSDLTENQQPSPVPSHPFKHPHKYEVSY